MPLFTEAQKETFNKTTVTPFVMVEMKFSQSCLCAIPMHPSSNCAPGHRDIGLEKNDPFRESQGLILLAAASRAPSRLLGKHFPLCGAGEARSLLL